MCELIRGLICGQPKKSAVDFQRSDESNLRLVLEQGQLRRDAFSVTVSAKDQAFAGKWLRIMAVHEEGSFFSKQSFIIHVDGIATAQASRRKQLTVNQLADLPPVAVILNLRHLFGKRVNQDSLNSFLLKLLASSLLHLQAATNHIDAALELIAQSVRQVVDGGRQHLLNVDVQHQGVCNL